jgi:hypothetical protein
MEPSAARPAGTLARPPIALAAGAVVLVLLGTIAWPAFTLLALAVAVVALLVRRAPAAAFALALALLGAEGTIKAHLTDGETPLPLAPNAVGAAAVDAALAVATVGLLAGSGAALGRVWHGAGRAGRLAIAALASWLVLSVPQILQSGDAERGLAGFRLTQAYALAAVAGALLLARGEPRVVRLLLAVLAAVAGYAALRALVGPSELERGFALTRAQGAPEYGEVFRTVGSFSSAVALASFLAPAGVLAFGLALLDFELRVPATLAFAAATVGVLGSYTRVALVALAVGAVAAAVLAVAGAIRPPRRRLAVAAVVTGVLALGAAATAVASRASPEVRDRARAFVDPLDDPSVRERLDTWREAARDVRRDPFGTGLGTVGRATESGRLTVTTDNSYLKVLREQGLVVGGLFLLGLGLGIAALARDVLRAPPDLRPFGVAAVAACAAFLVLAGAGEYVEQPGKVVFWMLLGAAAWIAWGRAPAAQA